ncbi:MAG: glycosyltransferase family 4 protein [Candidatus Methanomethylicaceae archaeon]
MKILYVSQSFFPSTGGVSYYLIWLARKLREMNHEILFINLGFPNSLEIEEIEGFKVYRVWGYEKISKEILDEYSKFKELILKVFHDRDVPINRLYNKHLYGYNGYIAVNRLFEKLIRKVIAEEKPDILHIHDFQLLPLGEILYDINLPKLFTWHIPFTEKADLAWKNFIISYLRKYDYCIFSTKPYICTALRGGLEWNKVVYIPPFIEVEDSNFDFRKAYGVNEDEKLILCVARIDKLKGQDILIDAASKLKIKFKTVFIGNGSLSKEVLKIKEKEEYLKELQRIVSLRKIKDKVIFTGNVSREVLMAAYKTCDVVVLPSIQEGFGLAITEGMAFGKPVIGSCVGGIPAQIWPGINGFLVPPGDSKALANCLEYILMNDDIAKKMGKESRKIFERFFSSERGARDHIMLYEKVLEGERNHEYRYCSNGL